MSDEMDWADFIARGLASADWGSPERRQAMIASELREVKLAGLREAADMAFAYAAKQEPQWKDQGMGPSADLNNFASGARHAAEHIRAHVDAIEKDNNG